MNENPETMPRISIHALREEGDRKIAFFSGDFDISIHALREEGDALFAPDALQTSVFLSTPSARRATMCTTIL